MPYTEASNPFRLRPTDKLAVFPEQMVSITPNDGADLATYVRALTCTGAGTVAVIPMRQDGVDTPVTLYLNPGQWTVAGVRKVLATGTTATGIVGALL